MEEVKEVEKAEKRTALLVWNNEKAVMVAAALIKTHKRLKIKPEDVFVIDLNKLGDGFIKYNKLIIVDPENRFERIASFFLFNHHKIEMWLAGTRLQLPNSSILKYYIADKIQQKDVAEYLGNDLELVSFLRAVKSGRSLRNEPPTISRHRAAIETVKIKSGKKSGDFDKLLKEIFFELTTQERSQFVEDIIFESSEIKVTLNRAKKKEIGYEGIGIIKIVEPKPGYFINAKEIFEEGLSSGYNAVAIKSPESGEFEICLKKGYLEKLPEEKILKRINGSRVVVANNFFD